MAEQKTTCEDCDSPFSLDEARDDFESDPEMKGLSYEEQADGLCGPCGRQLALEHLHAGAQYMYSLETGHPPEDMPDDWVP